MDLDNSLLSDDLMTYITTEDTIQTSGQSTPGDKSTEDIKNTSLARMRIRQSIDQTHKNSVNRLSDPRAIYQSLIDRYTAADKVRLRQLIRMIAVATAPIRGHSRRHCIGQPASGGRRERAHNCLDEIHSLIAMGLECLII